MAGLSASAQLECFIDTLPPAAGEVWIEQAETLAPGVFTAGPSARGARKICWRGFGIASGTTPPFSSSLRPIDHFVFSTHRLGDADASIAPPLTVNVNQSCLTDSTPIDEGASVLQLRAVSSSGLRGAAAEAMLVIDTDAPVQRDEPSVEYASECCLAVSWAPWAEPTSRVIGYRVCMDAGGNVSAMDLGGATAGTDSTGACVDVGNATRVVLAAEDCECSSRQAQTNEGTAMTSSGGASHLWQRFYHLPLISQDGDSGEPQARARGWGTVLSLGVGLGVGRGWARCCRVGKAG